MKKLLKQWLFLILFGVAAIIQLVLAVQVGNAFWVNVALFTFAVLCFWMNFLVAGFFILSGAFFVSIWTLLYPDPYFTNAEAGVFCCVLMLVSGILRTVHYVKQRKRQIEEALWEEEIASGRPSSH